jgi:hypothetical protein
MLFSRNDQIADAKRQFFLPPVKKCPASVGCSTSKSVVSIRP